MRSERRADGAHQKSGTLGLLLLIGLIGCAGPDSPIDTAAASVPRGAEVALVEIEPPSGPGAMAPHLTLGSSGVLLTWIEPSDVASRLAAEPSDHRLLLASWDREGWSPPRELTAGGGFFANWADVPAVAEGADGSLLAHWLEKLGEGTYAYGVQLTRSVDQGAAWDRLGLLHDDASEVEHGFVSSVPLADGIQAFWLDGRAMDGDSEGPMQLRTTKIGSSGDLDPSTLLDDRVCECCQTDAALTSGGPIVAYRDRSATEVRDISVIRAVGDGWSESAVLAEDAWEMYGCPVNGPAVAADGESVAIAWFTGAGGEPRVSVAFSSDAGVTFGSKVAVDAEQPLGRVDVALDATGQAWVSWLAVTDEERGEVRLLSVTAAGELGEVQFIAETTTARSAGVPRMIRRDDRLVLVWVEDTEPSRLRMAVGSFG